MRPYIVRPGDHLTLIAHRLGLDVDTIWNDPKNADLKKLRGTHHILCAGDVLYVPETPSPRHPLTTGALNTYVTDVPTVSLVLTFKQCGKPMASASCVVHGLPDATTMTTDGAGTLNLTVPVTVRELAVEFPDVPLIRHVSLGDLDPITEPSGVVQRLRNLRYLSYFTTIQPSDTAGLKRVLSKFQEANGLPVTGTLDDPTRSALEQAHGC